MDFIFRLSNVLVLPYWALVILLPGWRWTARIMRSPFVSGALVQADAAHKVFKARIRAERIESRAQ
jgi:hypothetical protein